MRLTPMNLLLVAVPVAVGLKLFGVGGVWMFAWAGVAIVPLAGQIGKATEVLAARAGATVGALLNATFGNATELVIALIMLARGPELYPAVKATITGSILANVLLILGVSITLGGTRYRRQRFNPAAAGVGSTLLVIAAAGLLVPTLVARLSAARADSNRAVVNLSEEISVVLLVLYGLNLWFTLRTHAHLFTGCRADSGGGKAGGPHPPESDGPGWGVGSAVGVLVGATVAVAVLSEWLVGALEPAAAALGMTQVFVGVVVVAIVGSAAEHVTAARMALHDKMDVALQIATSSSIQLALFVGPVLVLASLLFGHPQTLDLHFSALEVVAVVLGVAVLALVARDGETHWLEGAMLLALYLILAFAFYNLPAAD